MHKIRLIQGQNLQSWKKIFRKPKTYSFHIHEIVFDYTHDLIMLTQENRRIQENSGSGGWALMNATFQVISVHPTPTPAPMDSLSIWSRNIFLVLYWEADDNM